MEFTDTILIVDDEQSILHSIKRLLRNEHFEILTANSADEAIELLREKQISVLLTDNLMPGKSGLELVEYVKSFSPDTIRIIMSGHSDMDAVLTAVNKAEVFRFILKPWNDKDLMVTINLALAYYHLFMENKDLKESLVLHEEFVSYIERQYPEIYQEASRLSQLEAVGERG